MDYTTIELSDIVEFNGLNLSQKSLLPKIAAIYFVVQVPINYLESSLLYIGRARNLYQRWQNHQKHKILSLMNGVMIFYIEVDVSLHQELEWQLIDKFKPLLNESNPQPNSTKDFSAPRTIRFSKELDKQIATTAIERNISFSALVNEFCRDRLIDGKLGIEQRLQKVEQKISDIEARLDAD